MSSESVKRAWHDLETWFQQHQPSALELLNPGATESEIAETERQAGELFLFPEELRTSLLIHNGENFKFETGSGFLLSFALMTEHGIWRSWDYLTETWQIPLKEQIGWTKCFPRGAITDWSYNSLWTPFARGETDRYLAIDHNPGPQGEYGQVIYFNLQDDVRAALAPSLSEFLFSFCKLLQSDLLEVTCTEAGCRYEFEHLWYDERPIDVLMAWIKEGRWPMVSFEPSWRTSSVMALANAIESTRDFSAMPILADA